MSENGNSNLDGAATSRMASAALECNKYSVVMACDEAYAMPLATSIRSIVEANRSGRRFDIFVLTSEFSEETKRKVVDSLPGGTASLHWVHVDLSAFANFSTLPYLSKVTYARLLLHLLPDDVAKVLYLDADILVLDDLGPLWGENIEGAVLGAVVDVYSQIHVDRMRLDAELNVIEPKVKTAGQVAAYFNAGVLLVNLVRWREEHISQRALEYLGRHPQTPLSDQDALNIVCVGRWKQLDRRWNYHYSSAVSCVALAEQPISIVHFVGRLKPWKAVALSDNAQLYDAFRSRTRFARTARDKARDAVQRSWARLKRLLKQYELVLLVHSYLTGRRIIRPV